MKLLPFQRRDFAVAALLDGVILSLEHVYPMIRDGHRPPLQDSRNVRRGRAGKSVRRDAEHSRQDAGATHPRADDTTHLT